MKYKHYYMIVVLLMLPLLHHAQSIPIIVNMAFVDGVEINPDNIFNLQLVNNTNRTKDVRVNGTVICRRSKLRFSYSFKTKVYPGVNTLSKNNVYSPVWNFSSTALRELFFDYKKLPQGSYEYCVEIDESNKSSENNIEGNVDACVYYTVKDVFLINLLNPEDDALIYEHNPMLSWIVNYPFVSALKYKIRIAELKDGQNKENAIVRNNTIYSNSNLFITNMLYPTTAKPLKVNVPYVWAVDAYYKGLLLGGSEVWKFTIVEDSFLTKLVPQSMPYLDLKKEKVKDPVYAVGSLKLKYFLKESRVDTLSLKLYKNEKEIKLPKATIVTSAGNNMLNIDFTDKPRLKHMREYKLIVKNIFGKKYIVIFKYVNPDLYEK